MLQPKDKDWLNGYKNKTPYMLSTRDSPQNKGHIQTESEGLEKDISHKWIPIRITADLLLETLQARKEWQDILKVMKKKNVQPSKDLIQI